MRDHFRARAIAVVLAGGVALPTAAFAQTAVNDSANRGATPAAAGPGEIVVTAQRRSERLRDVPISITALDQAKLVQSGVNNLVDLQRVTPGVQLPFYGSFLQPAIRGISSAGAGLGDSSNVAVYIDGIYQPSESGQLLDLPDVEEVEVLKGPQGTLYGQNAAGGAIIVNTISPSFDLKGRLSASYGNYDDKSFRGYVTGPIAGDKLAASIAASYEDRDGFFHDILRGGSDPGLRSVVVRGKLLFKPTDRLSFTLGSYYTRRSDSGVVAGQPIGPGTPLGYALAAAYGLTVPKPTDPREFAQNIVPLSRSITYGFNFHADWETDLGTLSSVTAYGNVKIRNHSDVDFTAVNLGISGPLYINNHNLIEELNFTSRKIGRATFSAGLFFMDLKESYAPNDYLGYFNAFGDPLNIYPSVGTPTLTIDQYAYNHKLSYAGYLEAGYDLTDQLNLTVGGRYSYETQQTADNHSVLLGAAAGPLIPDPRGKVPFKRFTPRAVLRYALNSTSNVYASYSQGFKSGYVNSGDNPFVTPYVKPVQPEKVYAYEIGYKGRLARGVSLNLAAFYYDYKDLQVYVYSPPVEYYQNAASARIKGLDGDVTINLGRGLTFSAGGAYLDAKYRKFPNAEAYVPDAAGFGYDVISINASGNRLPRAPKFSGNATLDYRVDTSAGRFGANVSGTYNSGITYDAANEVWQKHYATLGANISFEPAAIKGLRLVLWGKNLTNKTYLSSELESQFVIGGTYAEPRTYGVRAEFVF
jgi:iron complex outermembrane recepter protein